MTGRDVKKVEGNHVPKMALILAVPEQIRCEVNNSNILPQTSTGFWQEHGFVKVFRQWLIWISSYKSIVIRIAGIRWIWLWLFWYNIWVDTR